MDRRDRTDLPIPFEPQRRADLVAPPGAFDHLRRPILDPSLLTLAQVAAHGVRLASYATALGRRIGLGDDDLETLWLGSLLHDVGKHAMPPDLLSKRGALLAREFEVIKEHPVIGDAMCAGVRALERVRPIVRHHHERLDGSGYPDGIGGEELSLLVQVVAVADVYDALVHERSYKPALDSDNACSILAVEADKGWRSRDLVWEFIGLVQSGPAPHTRRPQS